MGINISMLKRCKEYLNHFVKEQIRKIQEGPDQSEGGGDLNVTNAPDVTNFPRITNNPVNFIPNDPIN
eukprot:4997042-Ditylum_brightwellii.AAC.1